MNKTVVFDFDGVIHNYSNGWKAPHIIDDEPVPGIREAISDIRAAGYKVVVVSARCGYSKGKLAILRWLHDNDIVVDDIMTEKPPAICYIDDRAICFDGNPETLLDKIDSFETWNKKSLKDILDKES